MIRWLVRKIAAAPLTLLLACAPTSSTTDEPGSSSAAADTSSDEPEVSDPPESCAGVGSSSLSGVCIWFPTAGESWTLAEVAKGVTIPYQLIVEADVANVVPRSQDAGGCGQPDASGLILFERVSGGDDLQYCVCDTGLCPGAPNAPATVPAGATPYVFEWTGVSWFGPSDFGNPHGPPFPAGEHVLEVSAIGTVDGKEFEVSNTFKITLTE